MYFLEQFAEQVDRTPSRVAANDCKTALSYQALDFASDNYAKILQEASVSTGDVVAICLDRSVEFLIAMLAIFKVGGAYVPVDLDLPKERRDYLIAQCNCRHIIADGLHSDLPDVSKLLVFPSDIRPLLKPAEDFIRARISSDTLAYVIFTSGSTGLPKGAMVHHGGMINHLWAKIEDLDMGSAPNLAQSAPQSFDISVWQFLAPLLCGGRTAILTKAEFLDLDRLGSRIEKDEIDILQVVPSHLLAILEDFKLNNRTTKFNRLKFLVATGEVLPVDLARHWLSTLPHIPLVNAYGPTECSDDVTHHILRDLPSSDHSIPIGRAIRGVDLMVLDPDLSPVPDGQVGELHVSGIAVGEGYIGRPDLTEKAFITLNGRTCYKTGDLVSRDADHVFHYHGRADDQVKILGHRIELSEVEFGLSRLEDIKHAAVILNKSRAKPFLTAFLVPNSMSAFRAEVLKEKLADVLPGYMIPSDIRAINELPLTPNGKIDKKKLATLAADATKNVRGTDATTSLGNDLLGIWRDLLGQQDLRTDDNLFRTGADSIHALQFLARARSLGLGFTLSDVFQSPTVSGLEALSGKRIDSGATGFGKTELAVTDGLHASSALELTPGQEGIYVQSQSERHKHTYILQFRFHLSLKDGTASFKERWQEVHQRHDLFRSSFSMSNKGRPARCVHVDCSLKWSETDLSEAAGPDQFKEIERYCRHVRETGFRLEDPGCYRLKLFRLSDGLYYFVVTAHHMILDGVSVFPLLREVFAHDAVQEAPSAPVGVQLFRKDLSAEDIRFWQSLFADDPTSHIADKTLERIVPAVHGTISRPLSVSMRTALETTCRALGVTTTALASAAWAMTINSVNASTRSVFGLVVSGRSETGLGQNAIGMFANTLPLVITQSTSETSDFVTGVHRRLADALKYEVASLRDILECRNGPASTLPFDSVLNVETMADWSTLDSDGESIALDWFVDLTEFPVAVEVLVGQRETELMLNWDTECVSEDRACLLLDRFEKALAYVSMLEGATWDWQQVSKETPGPAMDKTIVSLPLDAVDSNVSGRLLALCREVIGVEGLSLSDNFFASGGDSITALQLMSRLRSVGLSVKLEQIFQAQSLNGIAASIIAVAPNLVKPSQTSGPTPLLPIQHWFFEQEFEKPDHWCLGTALELHRGVTDQHLQQATRTVLTRYPVLCAKFRKIGECFEQYIPEAPANERGCHHTVPLSGTSRTRLQIMETFLASALEELDLENGDLFRVIHFTTPGDEPDILIIVAHHLVMDGVSLRLLSEDYLRLLIGEDLPSPSTSIRSWAKALDANLPDLKSRLTPQTSYWKSIVEAIPDGIPFSEGRAPHGGTGCVTGELDEEHTTALLQRVPAVYDTQINDILLSCLVRTFREVDGLERLVITLEGHGREPLLEGVDISQTVGWFTSAFPVCLKDEGGGIDELILATKANLRDIPDRGVGYGILRYACEAAELVPTQEPMLQFNYLGQWDNLSFAGGSASIASPHVLSMLDSVSVSERNHSQHALEIEARIVRGRLAVDWYFDKELIDAGQAEAIAKSYLSVLRSLIAFCLELSPERIPRDYPFVTLSTEELKAIISKAEAPPAAILPVTPPQADLLFQDVLASDDTYTLQYILEITGTLCAETLASAWDLLVRRHETFRTGFFWDAVAGPVQYIMNDIAGAFSHRHGPCSGAAIETRLREDRNRGFSIEYPGAIRFSLISETDRKHTLLWSFHHILLDGWCVSKVLNELFDTYDELLAGQTPAPRCIPQYSDYVNWLRQGKTEPDLAFWKSYLSDQPRTILQRYVPPASASAPLRSTLAFQLDEDLTADFRAFCSRNRITAAVALQQLWGSVLSAQTGERSVVFGLAVSGRNIPLEGVEDIYGVFTAAVPCKVRFCKDWDPDALQRLQRDSVKLQEAALHSVSSIRSACGHRDGQPLYDTMLAVENFELAENLPCGPDYCVTSMAWIEKGAFPLVVGVLPGETVTFELTYRSTSFTPHFISELRAQILQMLRDMVDTTTVGANYV